MGNNLIHNYLNNMNNNQSSSTKKSDRSYFGVPSVSSTIEAFDQESDKLIKPLDGKGHLVNGDLVHMPKEFVRDTVYTTKALADGVRGKANDHQLGKLNDLGLKLSGLAIATYLMTRKATPKTKAMEFIGFGAFLASMALWPKLALEIPARIIHGFNFRKQYIDDQGRKKYVSQDPNYIPFDLYKGDKKSEDLDVIGDRLGIRRDIKNRHEAVKDQMRKISVQNNTLWMLTAGIATPLMTALACNKAEPIVTKKAEKFSNKKVNTQIDEVDDYLNHRWDSEKEKVYEAKKLRISDAKGNPQTTETDKLLKMFKDKVLRKADIAKLSDTVAFGQDAEMKDAARADIENLIGGEKYIANAKTSERLTKTIHSEILSGDAKLATKMTPDKIEKAISKGIVQGAVRDMLTSVGIMIDGEKDAKQVATNFKCREVKDIDFFVINDANKDMSPVDRLAHNIKSIVMKVNNSNKSEDFVSGMTEVEQNAHKNNNLKARIDAKLQADSEAIARKFYEGELAIGEGRESYIRTEINNLFRESVETRGPKTNKIFEEIKHTLSEDVHKNTGYVIDSNTSETIAKVGQEMRKYSAVDKVLSETAHFKLEKASETLVANNWAEVSDLLVKELNYTDKEIAMAAKDKLYSNKLFEEKLTQICSDKNSYKKFITTLAQKMAELDEKMDTPNEGKSGRMMNKIESGIVNNCTRTGKFLESLGMSSMYEKMLATYDGSKGMNVGSVMSSKILRLHSRIDGVHNAYMRLIQAAEFIHRANGYQSNIIMDTGKSVSEIAKLYGMAEDETMCKEIIKHGKELLLDAHSKDYYNKLGSTNNPKYFETLFWSLYKPNDGADWNANWNDSTQKTIDILDSVKSKTTGTTPKRVFDANETKPLGQKLKEHMNMLYNSLGSIERQIVGERNGEKLERIKCGSISSSEARACKRFDLLGKAPNEFIYDTLKQKYNSGKWMKMFAPVLGATFGATVLAQFFFGKKDSDVRA